MIFEFTLSGREEEIVRFEKELLDILQRIAGREEMTAYEIHFCVHEAILNVIQHTYKWDLKQSIDVCIDVKRVNAIKQKIEIFIRDYGPKLGKPIIPPKQIGQFQLRKRGLYMISKIMDECVIKPQGKGGNLTYMKKLLSTNIRN
jgi:anti-sigma regulatory factor (Ser/Thr protein kinase)